MCVSSYYYMCVLNTTIYASSCYCMCVLILLYVSLSRMQVARNPRLESPAICVLTLLYMCPHTAVHVSSYYYISVLILLCVLILRYTCPHTTISIGGAPQDGKAVPEAHLWLG